MKAPSLALRVIGLLVLAQLPAFLLVLLLLNAEDLASYKSYEDFRRMLDDLAPARTTDLVAESLIKDDDGPIRIVPTGELRSEMRRAPDLHFAAFDPIQWTPLAGSSPELTVALSGIPRSKTCHMHFSTGDPSKEGYDAHLACRATPYGPVPIALSGYKFLWTDIFELFQINWHLLNTYVIVGSLVTGLVAWAAVRHGLRPLADVRKKVESIQINSLNQRLSTVDIPAEVRTLVDGMNDALKRLDSSVERERRFAANAAHELRTPLAIMRARLENAKASSLTSELIGDTDQLRSIVEQMLISVRLAEGRVALDERVDLDKIIRRLVSDLLPLAVDRDRFLDFRGSATSLVVRGNRRAIESVMSNLIENGLREEPKDGTVCVRMEDDGVIAVIDHGKGVPPGDRELIFERFWRRSDASSGAGLGLAIAKDIVDAHHGRIWVEETPGGGATFKISFQSAVVA